MADRICRLCLRYSKKNLTPLFYGGRAKPYLVCFLKECCSLEVIQDDPMPKSICEGCRNNLIRVYDFRNQCHKSVSILRECYKLPPQNDCSQADECVVEKQDKAIQVECYDYSGRTMALQSLETENIEDEDSADDPRTMDIVGKVNHVNVDFDEYSVSHFYETVAQEVSNSIENTDDEPQGEAEVDLESFENQEPDLDEVNDVNVDMDENSVSHFYEFLDQEVSNDIENSDDNTPGEAEVEFESCEEQKPYLGKISDVKEGIDENSVSSGEANGIENESFEEQKPHQEEKGRKLKNEKILCNKCPSVFRTKHFLERHINNHLTIQTYTCEVCSRDFKTKGALTVHMKMHEEAKRFKCDVCGLKYPYKYLLNSHLRLHGRGKPFRKEKIFSCEFCSKSFVNRSNLKHHENLHTNAEHKCKFCDKTFKQETYKNQHEVRHRNIEFKCHLCPKIYASDKGLKRHFEAHRRGSLCL